MERLHRLVRSLRTARAAELPMDPYAAISTLLPLVMRNDHKTVAELLLSSDFNVNFRMRSERTLLHIAANVGAYDCLVILIKKDADVNCRDKSGVTPLQLAARNGHIKCIHKLLESKADIGICNSDGMTALHWIASNGRTELLNSILPFITKIDIEDVNKQTPLHLACLTGHKLTVQKLIENGADIDRLDSRGYTPLFYACSHGHADIVNELLGRSAKFSRNYDNVSPLQIALESGHKEVCFVLVEWNNNLIEELLNLAQDISISEEKVLGTLRYIASLNTEYHRTLLLRLADRSRVNGLELMSSSSDYEKTQQSFFKSLSLLCSMWSLSQEEMFQHPRSGSISNTVRSRFDSASARVLRTWTTGATPSTQPFRPPVTEIAEIFSGLWSSLENWFVIIKDEIHRVPGQNQGSESAYPNPAQDPDFKSSMVDEQYLETRLIASELVRSKPIDVSVRPRSTASMESILLSQPALEFNMARQSGDLNSSRGLSRDLGIKLLQRSLSQQREGDCLPNTEALDDDDDDDTLEDQRWPKSEEDLRSDLSATEVDYENIFPKTFAEHSTNKHFDTELDVPSFSSERSLQNRAASATDFATENLGTNLYTGAAAAGSETSVSQEVTIGANRFTHHSVVRRSISYTNAIEDNVAESNTLYARLPSIESRGSESIASSSSTAENNQTEVDRSSVSLNGNSSDHLKEAETESSRVNMVERFADRLCAVVHGYHQASYSRPYWESSRKFKIRVSKFQDFIEKNEEVLQLFVARKAKLIFDHFQFLLDSPILLQRYLSVIRQQPFKERLEWFHENLHKEKGPEQPQFDERNLITISRDELLLNSCEKVMEKKGDALKMNLAVRFDGEAGMGEGVVREWLDLLFKEVLNPDYALFTLSADGSTFQPNSNSAVNPDHLNYFLFAGRMMGLAMYHKRLISASFTRSFYKHILGIPVNYQDVASMDPDYAKNLQWILDNDISGLGLDLNFAVETKEFGQVKVVPLKLGGNDILVTEENKEEYVQLAADMKMTRAIKPQIYSFLEGFHEFIPHSLVALFNECELDLILSGVREIDVEDWERNTIYQAGYDAESQPVKWFWEAVREFNQEDLANLLQFVSGSSRVPWGGFASLSGAAGPQKFTISAVADAEGTLPSASTCFNLLKLPEYLTKEDLVKKLRIALKHGFSGFEFA